MLYFFTLVVDGLLSGAVYGLIALALVVVFKATKAINLALGEWITLGPVLVTLGQRSMSSHFGSSPSSLPLQAGGMLGALVGLGTLASAFNRAVLARLIGRPVAAVLLATLGLGAVIRGLSDLLKLGGTRGMSLPLPHGVIEVLGVPVPAGKLAAAGLAMVGMSLVGLIYQRSRIGLALRAVADDERAAMAVGIDVLSAVGLAWRMTAALSVFSGLLWVFLTGGGFGLTLLGLKILPVVVIGGLDSLAGALIGAMAVGLLESLAAGYLDPTLGTGFSGVVASIALIAVLTIRPYGLFGTRRPERV